MTKSITLPTGWTGGAGSGGGGGAVSSVDGMTGDVSLEAKYLQIDDGDFVPLTGGTLTGPLTVAPDTAVPALKLTNATPAATLGPDVVVNGAFTTDLSGWTVGAGWAWNAGTAKHSAGSVEDLTQTLAGLVLNETYVATVTIAGRTTGTVDVLFGPSGQSVTLSATGVAQLVVPSGATSLVFRPTTDFDGALDAVTLTRVVPSVATLSLDAPAGTTSPMEIRANVTNMGIGPLALSCLTTGTNNTALGYRALRLPTTATNNTGIGYGALAILTTGASNTALGAGSMQVATTAFDNTGCGYEALRAIQSGSGNTAVGKSALRNGLTLGSNTAVGNSALVQCNGASNVAVGQSSGAAVTTGGSNTAIGTNALLSATTGANNTALGFGALRNGLTFASNTGIGANALQNATSNSNVGVGLSVGYAPANVVGNATTTGSRQTLVGYMAGQPSSVQTNDTVALGYYSLAGGGDGATAIGSGAQATAAYAIAIGKGATATAAGSLAIGVSSAGVAATTATANQIVIGTASHTVLIPGYTPTMPAAPTFTSVALGTNPAASGTLRLPNTGTVNFRNAANNADLNVLAVNASDQAVLTAPTGSGILMYIGTKAVFTADTTKISIEDMNLNLGVITGCKIGLSTIQRLGFWNKTPIVQPTGMPAAATDATTTQALANFLRTLILNLGLCA